MGQARWCADAIDVFGGVGGGVGSRANLGCGGIAVFGSPLVTPSPARRFAGLKNQSGLWCVVGWGSVAKVAMGG